MTYEISKESGLTLNTTAVTFSLAGMVLYALGYFIWGEKLPVAEGLGWDGTTYASYVTHFIYEIRTTNDVYHVTRIFPSFLLYGISKLLGLQLTTPHSIVVAFYILNNVMFLAVGLLWYKICKLKAFNTAIYLLGFISLFINYACLKLSQYAPVFVDPTVLLLGTWVLYYYLQKKYIAMGLVLLPAFFTWPIALPLTLSLFLYPFSDSNIIDSSHRQKKWGAVIAITLFIGCVSGFLYVLLWRSELVPDWYSLSYSWNKAWWPPNSRISSWITVILPLNLFIACIYVYCIAFNGVLLKVIKNSYRVYLPTAALAIGVIALCEGLFFWISHLSINYTGKTIFSGSEFLALTVLGAIAKPAFNLIMHAAFLGPCTLLWLFYMRPIMIEANEERFGLLIFVIITYVMALNTHSRQLTFNLPFMIYLLCKVLDNFKTIPNKTQFLVSYALAALVGSKIYYLINVAPMQGDILKYPFQRFFMNFGLWTMWPGYFFNGVVVIIMCLLLLFAVRKTQP